MILPQHAIRKCRITPVRSRYKHVVHSYHAVPAWNPDGTLLLYLGVDEPGRAADVVVQELRTGRETVLGSTTDYNFHCAAWQQWVLGGKAVVYGRGTEEGHDLLYLAHLDRPGAARALRNFPDCNLRNICTNDRYGTGNGPSPRGEAIQRFDFLEEKSEVIVTMEEALKLYPREYYEKPEGGLSYVFSHAVTNHDDTRMFFKIGKQHPTREYGYPDWGAFYAMDLPAGELRCLGNRISGHPIWMPDGRHILNVKNPLDGSDNRWIVLWDSVTGADERIVDQVVEGPFHPALSPNQRYVVMDSFTRDGLCSPIYVLDLQSGEVREIARLKHVFRGTPYSAITRGQPHPSWSPDGRQVLVNCNETGERMGMYVLDDFLP